MSERSEFGLPPAGGRHAVHKPTPRATAKPVDTPTHAHVPTPRPRSTRSCRLPSWTEGPLRHAQTQQPRLATHPSRRAPGRAVLDPRPLHARAGLRQQLPRRHVEPGAAARVSAGSRAPRVVVRAFLHRRHRCSPLGRDRHTARQLRRHRVLDLVRGGLRPLPADARPGGHPEASPGSELRPPVDPGRRLVRADQPAAAVGVRRRLPRSARPRTCCRRCSRRSRRSATATA